MIHIKNLAEQTNITVRTLRYYEQIGLLVSSSKTEGGHRLYTEGDLQKLQQIQFYKNMGYRLSDIKEMLTDPEWNWSDGLANQLTFILEEQSRLNEMEQTLRALVSGIAVEEGNQEKAIQQLIKLSLQDKRGLDQYRKSTFTDAELGLWAKLPKMSVGNPESMEWIALVGLLTKYYTCKEPLSSPCVQNVIRRMLEKQEEEYGGQDAFIDKLWEMRKNPSASEQLGLYPIKSEVLEYMDQAYGIFISSVEQTSTEEGGRT
ncbi:MerR family transcriptional regulator [Paenibacillus sp. J45TS6]|uniref:MerR family transcriptional regulator n=1 Tax=Paenibacillus sp. J45TS6 TaxID=2807196 RepID=UPI001B100B39|nr:MerR family transcriptional regulator [Paenibacillus sp. J45TS6]GIP43559.1 MerR family transcriptional regulator [Paenibacillus sp. J45TS6]